LQAPLLDALLFTKHHGILTAHDAIITPIRFIVFEVASYFSISFFNRVFVIGQFHRIA